MSSLTGQQHRPPPGSINNHTTIKTEQLFNHSMRKKIEKWRTYRVVDRDLSQMLAICLIGLVATSASTIQVLLGRLLHAAVHVLAVVADALVSCPESHQCACAVVCTVVVVAVDCSDVRGCPQLGERRASLSVAPSSPVRPTVQGQSSSI